MGEEGEGGREREREGRERGGRGEGERGRERGGERERGGRERGELNQMLYILKFTLSFLSRNNSLRPVSFNYILCESSILRSYRVIITSSQLILLSCDTFPTVTPVVRSTNK